MKSKKKFILLMTFSVLLLLISYLFAFSKTIAMKGNYSKLKSQENQYRNIPEQIQVLSKKEVYYDSILSKLNLSSTSLENNLLKLLTDYSTNNQIKIKNFNSPHDFVLEKSSYTTYNFTLEGSYTAILKLIYKVEQNSTYGEVIHVDFKKETNFRTRRKFLTAKVFVQSVQ